MAGLEEYRALREEMAARFEGMTGVRFPGVHAAVRVFGQGRVGSVW
jgi:hypothetical protein